ncbi:phytoene/squalene synthase family protein [Burkholderia sp. Cy-637]|uniref:phytoene/squalene synthase family protein n=1 Tax=Burkholderia sp. Cy-637 TaxID=2608327 RepID=UPI0014219891|nr:phytoene/squalene synthase family protein [Burkholderia sp. Cy-637]NIF88622.1 squalene/phytoene synthase family protein [Burkholderia sp. Cy-637]
MTQASRAFLLGPLLKGVSRSFYLTLAVLPVGMRDPIGLAYLLARAADTIADTSLLPPARRLEWLLSLRAQVNGRPDEAALRSIAAEVAGQQTDSDEKVLLESLGPALGILAQLDDADRAAVRGIVTTLSEGMEFDLVTFPDETSGQLVALPDDAALDRYTYMVAGCVGEFWTTMTFLHEPGVVKRDADEMKALGIRFGKALQLTNVLRDAAKDLRIGRCYLPADRLARGRIAPGDLLGQDASQLARPVMFDLVRVALAHYRAGIDYTFAIPPRAMRLRLACIWPIVIGLMTLRLLVSNPNWIEPGRASKVRRNEVYKAVACSIPRSLSNGSLRRWFDRLLGDIERVLDAAVVARHR